LKTSSFSLTEFFSNEKEASALGLIFVFVFLKKRFKKINKMIDSLKPDAVLAICQMYQKHMKKSALTITHDQVFLSFNLDDLKFF